VGHQGGLRGNNIPFWGHASKAGRDGQPPLLIRLHLAKVRPTSEPEQWVVKPNQHPPRPPAPRGCSEISPLTDSPPSSQHVAHWGSPPPARVKRAACRCQPASSRSKAGRSARRRLLAYGGVRPRGAAEGIDARPSRRRGHWPVTAAPLRLEAGVAAKAVAGFLHLQPGAGGARRVQARARRAQQGREVAQLAGLRLAITSGMACWIRYHALPTRFLPASANCLAPRQHRAPALLGASQYSRSSGSVPEKRSHQPWARASRS